ncbi:hypothetical protein RclHR1_08250002 [Rhizophagus clarus]|uniref:MIR domain-containing protein n=1 Tax=Rhizophagus clarus TaxID=94130 RepID=A0A2Z6SBE5_9GLOM|nr:hypothetical protein RclHR1_08250002 [Rhizophagus clarus]GES92502.1 hypothetical protein GLOIN_2v1598913 [Rhizophagus clarus]
MEPPKYDGTIHPEEWIRQILLFCHLKQITTDQEILKICKLVIDPKINVSHHINTIDELIKALKQDIFFIISKDDAKRKLSSMKYISENDGGNHIKFMKEFLTYCYNAEVYKEINEMKKYLCKTLKDNRFLQKEFVNKVESVDSTNELIKNFEEIVFKQTLIKYGSRVALRHVATGKYLTSIDRNYEKSQKQIVFAGKSLPTSDSTWIITSMGCKKNGDIVEYGDYRIGLINEETNKALFDTSIHAYCDTVNKSTSFYWYFQNLKSKEINSFVESQDIINIVYSDIEEYYLLSHEATFKVGNETFQEVVSSEYIEESEEANYEWCIELIK